MTTERQYPPSARRRHRWLGPLAACLLLGLGAGGAGAAPRGFQLELLLSDDGPAYRELAGAFQAELGIACAKRCPTTPSVRVSLVDDWSPDLPRDLLVTVGSEAAFRVAGMRSSAVLHGLIPETTWRQLQRVNPGPAGEVSAVFLNQPLERQFQLLTLALGADRRRVGVLLGPESDHLEASIRETAGRHGMVVSTRHVTDWDEVGPATRALSEEIDVLLAVPDSTVYNRDTLYGILLTSYSAGTPVIGYSKALVTAGAMLALYTSVPDMARHLAQVSADYLADGGALPAPAPSRYYHIEVNENVARSLGFSLPDAVLLRNLLHAMEGRDDAAQVAQ